MTVMELQDSVRHGEADAAALALGGEVEVEDAVANFAGDSFAVVLDFEDGCAGVLGEADGKLASVGHGLRAVDDDVEQGLPDKIGIDADVDGVVGDGAAHSNLAGLQLGGGEHEDAGDDG